MSIHQAKQNCKREICPRKVPSHSGLKNSNPFVKERRDFHIWKNEKEKNRVKHREVAKEKIR